MKTSCSGFTLLEILLAIVIIGVIATLAIPRLTRKDPGGQWENMLEEINNLVYYARQEAISNQKTYRLHFKTNKAGADTIQVEIERDNPEKPQQKIYDPIKSYYFNPQYSFPQAVELEAVYYGKEEQLEKNKGHAYCYVIPNGLVQDVLLHLSRIEKNKHSKASLKMLPFFGKFELSKGFLKPEK